MAEFTLGYREVIPDQELEDKWIDISLTTGGIQSTLQDIKATEKASGYSYLDSTQYYTRNRFIYWRIFLDSLELVEHSLDVNLTGNKVRYRFIDSPIIDGVSVQETHDSVVILVPTLCSVHRLIFPHPSRFYKQDELLGIHQNLATPSIFSKASSSDARNPNSFYVFNNPTIAVDQLPNSASAFYDADSGQSIFVLSYPNSEAVLINLNPDGHTICQELKGETLMPRFLSGLTEKFRSKGGDEQQVVATLIEVIDYEIYILTLTRNGFLKFWNSKNAQCDAAIDILTEPGKFENHRIQNAALRKCIGSPESDGRLALFISFSVGSQFLIINPVVSDNRQIQIETLHSLMCIETDLIDFCLQPEQIWMAWRESEDDCVIQTMSLQTRIWTPVVKAVINDTQLNRGNLQCDPREVYLQHLFHPGRFPMHIINKSLGIYRKSSMMGTEINLTSVAALKQAICLAIESDIQNFFSEGEVTDEEYLEYAEWCWRKFYSCCIQYHQVSLRPLGFMLLPQSCGAILLKKGTFSFLRPMESLENMALCSDFIKKNQFTNVAPLEEEEKLLYDLLVLFETLAYIDKDLNNTFKTAFETQVGLTLEPDTVILDLLTNLQSEMKQEYENLCVQISLNLDQMTDPYKAIHRLLELLRQDNDSTQPEKAVNPNAVHLFSSALGISFVACCLRQQCQNRFSICRNLLILCNILLKNQRLETTVSAAIHSVCKPEIIYLAQANYVMLWVSKLPALNNMPQESTLQRLNPIKLRPAYNIRAQGILFSLLELFVASTGGQDARKMFSRVHLNSGVLAHWRHSLLQYTAALRHILWPLKTSTVLPEWLVSSGQHVWLQQYVRLIDGICCGFNISSCNFLLAVSFLTSAENYKALDLFKKAAKYVLNEPFLQKLIKDQKGNQAHTSYYLKVIQLFELHKARDCAIEMADAALKIASADNPLVPTLYSIKFKHHLALRHYRKAFYTLEANPDMERKKDNLRDLVKTLLDERKFDVLLSFTYADMDELFTNILLTRARATDALDNVFYDFLYAYQISRGPLSFRLAASVMYEHAFRLSQCDRVESLEKQVKCLLAAKNMLQLVSSQYAWVVRPSDPDEDEIEVTLESAAGSQKDSEIFRIKKQVEVVTIDTIKKELTFYSAKLKLARFDPGMSSNVIAPDELVTLLNCAGLYKTALEVCSTYAVSFVPVFESLTLRCIALSEDENPDAWNWLVENDLQDLPANRENVSTIVWELLQTFLKKYEQANATLLHKAVCEKFISMRMYLPFWLIASYKEKNPAELLRLLHRSGRLEEAFEVSHEYLLAALGYGKELYGFKMPLAPNSQPFCLPVYEIQALVVELQMQNESDLNKPFEKEYQILNELFQKYLTTASRISNEKCQLLMPSFGSIQGAVASRMIF
ncbi:nuclear pore complex protein Nup160 homolog [Anthonomus grandis grandis]|uniref:nuclear pore complex protein Nup160 homolog n=1 Tax=Anthonomus grandis grandis TaxID=2921223 RepID=UPI002165D65E|nr:nuclear pore complex protein Nup160 homolog [Anthonomus grandis grandis]